MFRFFPTQLEIAKNSGSTLLEDAPPSFPAMALIPLGTNSCESVGYAVQSRFIML
jgi:hypothetical protein